MFLLRITFSSLCYVAQQTCTYGVSRADEHGVMDESASHAVERSARQSADAATAATTAWDTC